MGSVLGNVVTQNRSLARRQRIYALVVSDNCPTVEEMAAMFKVTEGTIYRDLVLLRAAGDVKVPNRIPLRRQPW